MSKSLILYWWWFTYKINFRQDNHHLNGNLICGTECSQMPAGIKRKESQGRF